MHDAIERYWYQLSDLARAMPHHTVTRAAEILLDCYRREGTVFIAGNGGSAATASHFACDLAKGARVPGLSPFRVVALTDNVPLLTAWANDTNYARVFAEQLVPLIRPLDVLVIISASGNSPNILAAAEVAQAAGATTISLTGRTGGRVRRLSDLTVRAPSDCVEMIEDAHTIVAHSVCVALRESLSSVIEFNLAHAVPSELVPEILLADTP